MSQMLRQGILGQGIVGQGRLGVLQTSSELLGNSEIDECRKAHLKAKRHNQRN